MPNKRFCTYLFLLFVLSLIINDPATARASGGAVAKQDEPVWVVPSHIQLSPMMVPVTSKYTGMAVVSMFIQVTDKKFVGDICRRLPRIRDAVLTTLSRNPIPVKRKQLQLTEVQKMLQKPIDTALGGGMIRTVHIVQGALQMSGGSLSRLPFSSNGCKTIRQKEAAALKAKQKEQGH